MLDYEEIQHDTIEWMRFPMAVAVVIIHSECWGVAKDYFSTILFAQVICRIAVPCFFFFSGFLFFKGLEEWNYAVWKQKMKRRIHSLLIPYLIWNLLAVLLIYGYNYFASINNPNHPFVSFGGLTGIMLNSGDGLPADFPLWFLRDLIFITALTPLFHLLVKKMPKAIVPALFIMYLIFGRNPDGTLLCHFPEGLFFYISGAYLSIRNINFVKEFQKFKWLSYLVAIPLLFLTAFLYTSHIELYRLCKCIFVTVGVVAAINIVADLLMGRKLVVNKYLAKSSFFVFAAHGILIYDKFSVHISNALIPLESTVAIGIKVFLEAFITVVICEVVYFCIGKVSMKTLNLLNGVRA